MTNQPHNENHPSGKDYTFGLFKPEDAQGIKDLFLSVYGESYPVRVFYSPDELIKANNDGDYISVVARDNNGKVIAVEHLFRSAPNKNIYEAGAGLTLKEYRGAGIGGALVDFVMDKAAPNLGIDLVFGEAVCNHVHMQKLVAKVGCVDMAIEVALMPAEAYSQEKSATGRVAALLQFKTFNAKPHKVYIPSYYEKQLGFIYEELDDKREFETPQEGFPGNSLCRVEQQNFDFAKVSRMVFHELGTDFETRLKEMEKVASGKGVKVFQTWLPMGASHIATPVEMLRSKGYFFGGPLIQWFGNDGLLMQKLECSPDFEDINLHSQRARRILEMVIQDWEQTRG